MPRSLSPRREGRRSWTPVQRVRRGDEEQARKDALTAAEQAEVARRRRARLREAAEESARQALASEQAAVASRDAAAGSAATAEAATEEAKRLREQADEDADTAQARLLRALLEQGRQEMLVGRLGRAAPLLAAAYAAAWIAGASVPSGTWALRPVDARIGLLDAGDAPLVAAALTTDGSRALTATKSGRIRLWNLSTASMEKAFRVDGEIIDADLAPDGRTFLTATWMDVAVYDASSGRRTIWCRFERAGPASTSSMARSPWTSTSHPPDSIQTARGS